MKDKFSSSIKKNNSGSRSFTEKFSKRRSASDIAKNSSTNQKDKSFTNKVSSSQSDLVYLVKGLDEDKKAWYYLLVDKLKISLFLKDVQKSTIDLDDYGKVIYSGYGEDPPVEIKNKVKEEYNIND